MFLHPSRPRKSEPASGHSDRCRCAAAGSCRSAETPPAHRAPRSPLPKSHQAGLRVRASSRTLRASQRSEPSSSGASMFAIRMRSPLHSRTLSPSCTLAMQTGAAASERTARSSKNCLGPVSFAGRLELTCQNPRGLKTPSSSHPKWAPSLHSSVWLHQLQCCGAGSAPVAGWLAACLRAVRSLR